MDIAYLLHQVRMREGLSQRDLADRAGVPRATVGRVEAGSIDPRWSTAVRLLEAAGYELMVVPRPGRGVDRSLIRELLALTPMERIEFGADAAAAVERFRRGRRVAAT
jgi:DNA-binding XRE family transcriptional regulator